MKYQLDQLPVAAVATRDGVLVEANRAFVALTGWVSDNIVGKAMTEILEPLVSERDRGALERVFGQEQHGTLWCRIRRPNAEERPVRMEWNIDDNRSDALVLFLDGRPADFGQEVTDALARVAGVLSRCATEDEVLTQAVEALCAHGFTATVLLIDERDPLLRYGPSRGPEATSRLASLNLPRPPKEILTQLNPGFMDRRAAFFQDGFRQVREVYAEDVVTRLEPHVPAPRMVQAPLFLADAPYGALVVTGSQLNPMVVTALDLFAELVGKGLEAVRLRRELMERERLAALGEAAGVMAHEVRNPVGAIMNALTLLDRDEPKSDNARELLAIIAEETTRLEQLVSQLLELGRPLFPSPRSCSMEEVTLNAVRSLGIRGELRKQVIDLPEGDRSVGWVDPDLAEVSLVNVLRNALQSTQQDGYIRIRIEQGTTWVSWIVEDDGPGIPDATLKRIGQPFVTTRATGTGMGFAVVRRIMEASNGQLGVGRSDDLGGARITLRFPQRAAKPASDL